MTTQARILLLEDDLSLGQTLVERLEMQGYQIYWAKNLEQARKEVAKTNFDLSILDVTLPDGSGFDFAREMKKTSHGPFIFMTAMAEAAHRLEGFEIGADEFIPKPFHLKEILIRIKHVLSTHAVPARTLIVGDTVIDFEKMAVQKGSASPEFIPAKDFHVLEFLIREAPRVVSRDEILDKVWGQENFPSNRTVDNVIVRLRGLFDSEDEIIRSVRSVGYQWLGERLS